MLLVLPFTCTFGANDVGVDAVVAATGAVPTPLLLSTVVGIGGKRQEKQRLDEFNIVSSYGIPSA